MNQYDDSDIQHTAKRLKDYRILAATVEYMDCAMR